MKAVGEPKQLAPDEQWRFLAQSVWSELPAAQVLAVRLLRRMEDSQAWAREALGTVFLDEDVVRWVTESE